MAVCGMFIIVPVGTRHVALAMSFVVSHIRLMIGVNVVSVIEWSSASCEPCS